MELMKFLWLIIPAGFGNMMPPFAAKLIPKWTAPIDGGKSWRGIRWLGDHKTWRGLVFGIIGAEMIYLLQVQVFGQLYTTPWWFGGLLGLGALAGDAIKSFFKRRAGVKSGQSWFPWDQIDWIIGLVAVSVFWNILGVAEIIILLIIGLGLHLIVKAIGYFLKMNETII